MQYHRVPAGTTSKILRFEAWDSTSVSGARFAGLSSSATGLTCYYSRTGVSGAATAVTLGCGTKGTWTSSALAAVDATNMSGLYEFGCPNAVLASGATAADIRIAGVSGMVPVFIHLDLEDISATGSGALYAADAVWDEVLTGATHNIVNSAGRKLRATQGYVMHAGQCSASAATVNSITLDSSASTTSGAYDPGLIVLDGGTGAGQARMILDYSGGSQKAYVNQDWRTPPDTTTTYTITGHGGQIPDNEGALDGATATTAILNTNAVSVSGTYDGQTLITVAGTGKGQARLICDYSGSTRTATLHEAWDTTPASGTSYYVLQAGRTEVIELDDTVKEAIAAACASGVLVTPAYLIDTDASGHVSTVSTIACGVTVTAISDGAITSTTFADGAITASAVASDAIGAAEVSASAASEIGSATASGMLGPGASQVTVYVRSTAGVAIADVDAWVTSDSAGSTMVVSGRTDSMGRLVPTGTTHTYTMLTSSATYYLWAQKDGVNFIQGSSFTATAD